MEFDVGAADFAGRRAGCATISVEQFWMQLPAARFDAIHIGDVLEHLPDPADTVGLLLGRLKRGDVLFVEGPLETNASPVYWVARVFGACKRFVCPDAIGGYPPTHLFRTDAKQQKAFFHRVEPRLDLQHWQISETGWPYARGGIVKRAVAGIAVAVGGESMLGTTFGNRFRGVFRYHGPSDGSIQPACV